jgi:hypothetical protein
MGPDLSFLVAIFLTEEIDKNNQSSYIPSGPWFCSEEDGHAI